MVYCSVPVTMRADAGAAIERPCALPILAVSVLDVPARASRNGPITGAAAQVTFHRAREIGFLLDRQR